MSTNSSAKGYTHLRTSSTEINEHENDDIRHDGAHQEALLLRRVPDSLPVTAWLVIAVELCERFAYFGLLAPLQNYLQNSKDDKLHPGGLGLGQVNATRINMCFMLWSYLTPIVGAILADQYLGRLKTILCASSLYLVGLVVLVASSLPAARENGLAVAGLMLTMLLLGAGAGGIKPNVNALLAEQYIEPKSKVRSLKTGEKVILDKDMTLQRLFLLFYMVINIGSLSPSATTLIEHHVGFTSAFALPTVVFSIGLTILLLSKDRYTSVPPEGSVTARASTYLWIIIRNRGSFARAKEYVYASHDRGEMPPWDEAFAADLYRAIQACKIFLFYPFFWLAIAQMLTNVVSQAGTMETHGIPNDFLIVLNPISVLILGPLCEFVVYPMLRRIGIPFRPITRIACSFVVLGLAIAYVAAVQHAIYSSPPCYNYPLSSSCMEGKVPNQIHILTQVPVYILAALAEILGIATGYEYAFKLAPASMRSLVMAMFLSTGAVAAVLGIIISPIFTDPTLVWGYSSLSIGVFLSGAAFWMTFRGDGDKTESEDN